MLTIAEQGGAITRDLARLTYPRSGAAYSIGITGAPGAGKSSLTARLIAESLEEAGDPVAVLAIDPTSPLSGGAILGDRVRMQEHALNPMVYIRSMATRGHLGGLAAAVPDAVRVFDAAGWPLVLVETVGVGQVEVEVAASCDTVVVVLNPGWGDAVQANKAGLLEVADVLVINKADRPGVRETNATSSTCSSSPTTSSGCRPSSRPWRRAVTASTTCGGRSPPVGPPFESAGSLERRRTARRVEETERLASAHFAAAVTAELHRPDSPIIDELATRQTNPAEAADRIVAEVAGNVSGQERSAETGSDPAAGAGVA